MCKIGCVNYAHFPKSGNICFPNMSSKNSCKTTDENPKGFNFSATFFRK